MVGGESENKIRHMREDNIEERGVKPAQRVGRSKRGHCAGLERQAGQANRGFALLKPDSFIEQPLNVGIVEAVGAVGDF